MRVNVSKALSVFVGLFGIAAVGEARGAVITQEVDFSTGQLSSKAGNAQTANTLTAAFNAFNTSLGTLTSVSFTCDYKFDIKITGPSGGGGFDMSGPFELNGATFTSGGTIATTGGGGGGLLPGDFAAEIVESAFPVVPDNPLSTYLSPFTFSFVGTASLTVASPSSYNVVVSDFNTTQATANYTYTPTAVPEPTSLSLLGVGGIALLRRRRSITA